MRHGTGKSMLFVENGSNKRFGTGKAVNPTHNEGGILGGIGYVVGKTLTGIASVGEGIGDLVVGGIAELSETTARRRTYSATVRWASGTRRWTIGTIRTA